MNPATKLLVDRLNELAARGMNHDQAAAEIDCSRAYLVSFACRHGIKFGRRACAQSPVAGSARDPGERSRRMATLYRSGSTLQAIGTEYSITRERVRQILWSDHGIRGKDGGKTFTATIKAAARLNKFEAANQAKYGCSRAQYKEILNAGGTLAFSRLKMNAEHGGFEVDMTLFQWWGVWQASGHWNNRGRGRHGYWMFRLTADAPLSIDNYCIATGGEAMRFMRQVDPSRFPRRGQSEQAVAA